MTDQPQRFEYEIRACVRIDAAVIAYLMDCSKRHYDGHCRSVGQEGQFLYGWNNRVTWANGETTVEASFRELDTLAKLCEVHSPTPNPKVFHAIKAILDGINAEFVNLRELGAPRWNQEPFKLTGLLEFPPARV
jgi:hypothetical protein